MRAVALIVLAFAFAEDAAAPDPGEPPPAEGESDESEHTPTPPTPPPAPTKTSAARPPPVIVDGMVRVAGGKFTMGSDESRAPANERPAHVVMVPSFFIDRIEVTAGAYRACVDANKCPHPARSSAHCTYDAADPLLPISCVTWDMARAYCASVGKRLPREAEWEVAARGASTARYPWGGNGTSCTYAVTLKHEGTQQSCGRKLGPARVGTHPAGASPFGALDMSGNVEEWVTDWYGEGTSDLSPRAGAAHVLRGGGWLTPPTRARTTSRNWGSVREAGPNVGFRCARDG